MTRKSLLIKSCYFLLTCIGVYLVSQHHRSQKEAAIIHAQAPSPTPTPTAITDWPQLQNGPQRHGRSLESLVGPFSERWVYGFAPDRLHPQTQPIIVDHRLYIGTAMGTMYAFNALNGEILWTYHANGPILGTAGVDQNRLFFSDLNGTVYALNANATTTPEPLWTFQDSTRFGFSTSILLAEEKVYLTNRGGTVYALDQESGQVIWQRPLGAPVLMSSAYDNHKLFVGTMDLKVYALDAVHGTILWQSAAGEIIGAAFKDYWPVAYNNYVFFRPQRVDGGAFPAAQSDPTTWSMFVFNQNTGEPVFMPHSVANTMSGAVCPPAVDRDGQLITPHVIPNEFGGFWARLNTTTRTLSEIIMQDPGHNPDETTCTSTAGNLVFLSQGHEWCCSSFNGYWNLDTKQSTVIWRYMDQHYFTTNTMGGGGTPTAIANKVIYHTVQNNLNARTAANY